MKYQVRVKGRVNGHEVDTRFHMSANKKADEIKTKIKKITGVDRKCMVLEVKAPYMAPVRVTCIGDDAWTVGTVRRTVRGRSWCGSAPPGMDFRVLTS